MNEHITEWLGAYHDGELRGARARRVEAHLAACSECRAKLEALEALSSLLKETPPDEAFLSADRFADNLALRLPRRPAETSRRQLGTIGRWLVPVGLLLAWFFIDAAFSVSSVVTLAAETGLFGTGLPWGQAGAAEMGWFASAINVFGGVLGAPGTALLEVLNDANLFIARIAAPLIPQAILAAAYLGWLFSWWLGHQENLEAAARDK